MLDPQTRDQLMALTPIDRPLLVCDVDEVILHLVAPLERLLEEQGYELRKQAVRLSGNVFDVKTGEQASQQIVWSALATLFEEQHERQHVVDDAADTLHKLHQDFDIILLTNLPHRFGDIRRDYLKNIDIPFPVITNTGAKGPAMEWINKSQNEELAFVDDTPDHLNSVQVHAPNTHLVHFMANDEFRTMIGRLDHVLLSTGDWPEAGLAIRSALNGKANG